ncbi:MAG: bacteriohemerythrin [Candidatus Sumerlaeota bacterium]|nr:bacteriohemerythrin [Candidatus Sumerlaeota bacterium]
MPLFLWDEAFSVNVRELDDQHRRLIGLLNDLQKALQGTAPKERWWKALEEFGQLTARNFETEERLVLLHEAPDYIAHRVHHDRFLNQFGEYREQLESERVRLSLPFLEDLADWWRNHIVDFDAKCGAWLNQKGVV